MINKLNLLVKILGIVLLATLSACNLPASKPIPKVDPKVNIVDVLVVNTFRDTFDGVCSLSDCSLRDAVFAANDPTYVRNDITKNIIYLPSGLYKLNEQTLVNDDTGIYGDLDISSAVTIQGDGVDLTTIDGANNDRIFQVLRNGGNLTLYDMTLMGGTGDHKSGITGEMPSSGIIGDTIEAIGCAIASLWGGCDNSGTITNVLPPDYNQIMWERGGGAIANRGYLLLGDVNIIGNTSQYGGGIYNVGAANIIGGEICNNQGRYGGGIFNEGTLEIRGAIICNNNDREEPESWGPAEEWLDTNFDLLDLDTWLPEFESDLLLLGGGGGIFNSVSGILQANNVEISGNDLVNNLGKGIRNKGTLIIFDSKVINNLGNAILNSGNINISGTTLGLSELSRNEGIALTNIGEASISNTLIQNNNLSYGGTITILSDSTLTLYESAISDNTSNYGPGAIAIHGGKILMSNVSIGRNTSTQGKGVIFAEGGYADLINVTIFDNDTLGINNGNGVIWAVNTIIANNSGGNCVGTFYSRGSNLTDDDSCNLSVIGDIISQDLNINNVLDASTSYTYKILGTSPAHDGGDLEFCPSTDQQGEPRPMGLGCDIGADEIQELDGVQIIVPDGVLPPVEPAGEVVIDPPPDSIIPPVTADENANCRSGPGTIYNIIGFMAAGDTAEVLGQNSAYTWVFVLLSNARECWVFEDTLTEDSVFEQAEVLPDPPLPPTPTFTPTPTLTLTPTPTPTLTPAPITGSISGTVFKDTNGDGSNSGDSGYAGAAVTLGVGPCNSSGLANASSNGSGGFSFTGLSAGTYCLTVVPPVVGSCPRWDHASTSTKFTFNLSADQAIFQIIGFDNSSCEVD